MKTILFLATLLEESVVDVVQVYLGGCGRSEARQPQIGNHIPLSLIGYYGRLCSQINQQLEIQLLSSTTSKYSTILISNAHS